MINDLYCLTLTIGVDIKAIVSYEWINMDYNKVSMFCRKYRIRYE